MTSELETLLPLLTALSAKGSGRVSLADLAARAALSPAHFQRKFARVVGESPKEFTRRMQLEWAMVRLLTSDATVLDISIECGFESHAGFTRAFHAHFGHSPTRARRQMAGSELAERLRHARWLSHAGPCLRLFRASTRPRPREKERRMSYDITQQTTERTTVLYQTARVEHAEITSALGRMLPAVFEHATRNGIVLTGPPFARYVQWGPGMTTIEAGLAVAEGAAATGDIAVGTWQPGPAAVTVHTGPYDSLPEAHAAVETYLHEHGLQAGGPPREIYLTDPGEVPDAADWKTQIVWPIAQ